ncbi:MAG: translation initiation factor IF-2 subunit beta [Candidatus Nanoarchaeia archaeon]|jgi:translation initiation factor 2 subunit 2
MAWNHSYDELLKRVRKQLPAVSFKSERFEVPRVNGGWQGNHTIINNFKQISDYLRREPAHLLKFLVGELATQARLDGQRADFTGRFRSEEINKKVITYIDNFVKCKECGKPDTKLVKDDRLTMMKCMACGSKKPVRSIK